MRKKIDDLEKLIETLEHHRHEINEFDTGELTGEPLLDFPCREPSPPQSTEQRKEEQPKGYWWCEQCESEVNEWVMQNKDTGEWFHSPIVDGKLKPLHAVEYRESPPEPKEGMEKYIGHECWFGKRPERLSILEYYHPKMVEKYSAIGGIFYELCRPTEHTEELFRLRTRLKAAEYSVTQWVDVYEDMRKKFEAAEAERDDLQASFDLRWKADQRAIKMWHDAGGDELTWPNHADLCVWLMKQGDELREKVQAAVDEIKNDVMGKYIAEDVADEIIDILTKDDTQEPTDV